MVGDANNTNPRLKATLIKDRIPSFTFRKVSNINKKKSQCLGRVKKGIHPVNTKTFDYEALELVWSFLQVFKVLILLVFCGKLKEKREVLYCC